MDTHAWVVAVRSALDAVESAAALLDAALADPPAASTEADRAELQRLWSFCGGTGSPGQDAAASHAAAEQLAGRIRAQADRLVARLPALAAVVNAACKPAGTVTVPAAAAFVYGPPSGGPKFWACWRDRLPAGHQLRHADAVTVEGGAALLLGRYAAGQVPDWFAIDQARQLTAGERLRVEDRRRQDAEQAERERLWRADQQRWTDAGRLAAAERENSELRARVAKLEAQTGGHP